MKTTMLKILTASLICFSGITFTHAADMSKTEMQKQIQACMKKQQGQWVSYNYKGVIFNGTCEPNENGKLQFKAPAP